MEIDPFDERLDRWVVTHHVYRPDERQHVDVPVAAFETMAEATSRIESGNAELRQRRADGTSSDPHESFGGIHKPAHHESRTRNKRLLHRAVMRGVPPEKALAAFDVPLEESGLMIAYRRAEDDQEQ